MSGKERTSQRQVEDILRLSPMQEGMLFHYIQEPASGLYVEQICLWIAGPLRKEALEEAYNQVMQANGTLRTVFRWKKVEQPVQMVFRSVPLTIHAEDWSHLPVERQAQHWATWLKADRSRGFDLERGPLLRIAVCRVNEDRQAVVITFHHIILDGWSSGIFIKEVWQAYNSLVQERNTASCPKQTMKEYFRWLNGRDTASAEAHWQRYLEDFTSKSELPLSVGWRGAWEDGRTEVDLLPKETLSLHEDTGSGTVWPEYMTEESAGEENGALTVSLPEALVMDIDKLAQSGRVTVSTVLNAAWGIVLQRYNHCGDAVFGTTVAGRPAEVAGIETMLGLFINTVPLRVRTTQGQRVRELLQSVHRDSIARTDAEFLPLVQIKAQSEVDSESALFDSILVVENYPLDRRIQEMGLQIVEVEAWETTNFALTLTARLDEGIRLKWLYHSRDYTRAATEHLNRIYCQVLRMMTQEPDGETDRLAIVTEAERKCLLGTFQSPREAFPPDRSILRIWSDRVKQSSDSIALVFGETQMTYSELDQRARELGDRLRGAGVRTEEIVGIMAEPSMEMVVGILGIFYAGGAYLPMDPHYPAERISFMLEDCHASVLLTQPKWEESCRAYQNIDLICLDNPSRTRAADQQKIEECGTGLKGGDLAYVIYTSGSTGQPKGVLIEHHSLTNLLCGMQLSYPTRTGDTWLYKTAFTFDVSLTELFGWIPGGGRLAILEPGGEKEPRAICRALHTYQVTHLNFVPSMYNAWMEYLLLSEAELPESLRYIMVAGEAVTPDQVKRFNQWLERENNAARSGQIQLINLYGPTEATVYATHFPLRNAPRYQDVPIGRGMVNTELYIVDSEMNLQPIGFPGELCIGGEGVGRGYLHRPELTGTHFADNPFQPGRKMYRTGDLARWLPDGNIAFMGRLDQQVKVRGYRIEPGEIEKHLFRHPEVSNAAVVARTDNRGETYLCAYLVWKTVPDVNWIETIRADLAVRLPVYMIPAQFVLLPEMPLTASGKLNRKALPEPESAGKRSQYIAPRTEWERRLQEVWRDILGVEHIGVRDHFFRLGGHSLKAVQVLARVYKKWGIELTVSDLFAAPTIAELAVRLQSHGARHAETIPAQPEMEWYPLTPAQRRLYLMHRMEPESTVYNMPVAMEIRGTVDLHRWEDSLRQVVRRHAAFRTRFAFIQGEPRQQVVRETGFHMECVEGTEQGEESIREFVRPFDLSAAPLIRAKMVCRAADEYLFLLDLHHIITDGASLDLLIDEFTRLYQGETLTEPRLHYPDYAVWQRNRVARHELEADRDYWFQEMSGERPVLRLLTDFPRPPVRTFDGREWEAWLGNDGLHALERIAEANGVTLFTVLLACYSLLLGRYADTEETVIGTPVLGRSHPDLQNVPGMFVNTLPIRIMMSGDQTFPAFLQSVQRKVLQAMEHQDYPMEELPDELEPHRDISRNPLFDTVFVMEEIEKRQQRTAIPGLTVRYRRANRSVAKFDLSLYAEERRDGLALRWEYAEKLFSAERVARMSLHWLQLTGNVVRDPAVRLCDLEILSGQEKAQLLSQWNDTASDYPRESTIDEQFRIQARRTPEKTAVRLSGEAAWRADTARENTGRLRCENHRDCREDLSTNAHGAAAAKMALTYRELDLFSDRMADLLRQRGVRPDTIVGLYCERSPEMIIGMLAILKAGGAYLPIDPQWPNGRKAHLLRDAGVHIILAQEAVRADVCSFASGCECISPVLTEEAVMSDSSGSAGMHRPQAAQTTADHLAYVMYTSGSTGEPKGVMIPHRGVIRLLFHTNYIQLTEDERILQMAPYTFDASTFEIWAGLLFGGELILMPREDILSIPRLAQTIRGERITTCWLTSSLFNRVVDEAPEGLAGLRNLLIGGEALSVPHVRKIRPYIPNTRLINGYGPTENTTFTCFHSIYEPQQDTVPAERAPREPREVGEAASIPIGRPICNTRIYIFDHNMHLVPPGVMGEIYIAGDGLARGYLKRADWTAERFSEHPYLPGERVYRSGDLGWFEPDGTIGFGGRADQQVKVRGYRIEPGEIEANLLRHPDIRQAAVIVRPGAAGAELIAYVAARRELTVPELREYLARQLPDYMIPNYFVLLPALPLTANGKLNRRELPEPEESLSADSAYVAPANRYEDCLARLYAEVLGIGRVGSEGHFFHLGGHSLKAAGLAARLREEMGIDLPLRELFLHPVVRDLAAVAAALHPSEETAIPPRPERDDYPLTSGQKRLFILQQLDRDSVAYNIPLAYWLEGPVNHSRFVGTWQDLIQRHESLRTSFRLRDGIPVQEIHRETAFPITRLSLREEELTTVLPSLIRPFDLAQAPLWRLYWIEVERMSHAEPVHLLFMDFHHIITDGRSMEILMDEWVRVYTGEKLPLPRLRYRDIALWQDERFHPQAALDECDTDGSNASEASPSLPLSEEGISPSTRKVNADKAFWLEQFAGEIPVLRLPFDRPRSSVPTHRGEIFTWEMDRETADRLKKLAEAENVTLYMLLFAIYSIFLARYSGQEDLVVGTPVAGRSLPETQRIFGMFVNTLAVRVRPCFELPVSEFLRKVKEQMLEVYSHQEYPFEMLLEDLRIQRDWSRHPLFDTMFDLQNWEGTGERAIGSAGDEPLILRPLTVPAPTAKFDLNLTAMQTGDGIAFQWVYAIDLFQRETIEGLTRLYRQLFRSVADNPHVPLGRLALLTEEERREMLYTWNDSGSVEASPAGTVVSLLEETASRNPGVPALVLGDEEMSYGELNARANQWARALRKRGIADGKLTAIIVERSFAMFIGLFGIWKAGGAYVPIDPAYPPERIEYMLRDAGTTLLLTQQALRSHIPGTYAGDVLYLDGEEQVADNEAPVNPSFDIVPGQLAYMIYTSGSTGQPKGVLVEHRSLINSLRRRGEEYQFTAEDRILQLFSFAFDGFLISAIPPLMAGSTLVILHEEEAKNPLAICRAIRRYRITHFNAVPSLYSGLLDCLQPADLESLRTVVFGGEAVTAALIRRSKALREDLELANEYGPTENAVVSTIQRNLQSRTRIAIGRPIAHTRLYILDRFLEPVPPGFAGEICVAGVGLARGYWNRPELTAERFVADPFVPGERMYRTGDTGRFLPDGTVEYIGRMDSQVKVRGYRIEPGEIEAAILRHSAVHEAAVSLRELPDGSGMLAAYFTAARELPGSELRNELRKILPEYMIPAAYCQLDQMPLTPAGKIDLRALPEIHGDGGYAPPVTPTEKRCAAVWEDVLGVRGIGREDHFFALGGDSLKAMRILARIYQECHVELSVSELFEYPVLRDLAEQIEKSAVADYLLIPRQAEREWYPVSSAQKRIFVLNRLEGANISYNMPVIVEIRGSLRPDRLEDAMRRLIQRHESLRTCFLLAEGEPVQRIRDKVSFALPVSGLDSALSAETENGRQWLEERIRLFVKPFDLEQGPLFRAELIQLNAEHFFLFLDMHHIISDGVSMNILIREWIAAYNGEELPPLPVPYRDFAVWQNAEFASGSLQRDETYWLREFAGEIPVLNLPTDAPRPNLRGTEGGTVYLRIKPQHWQGVQSLANAAGATPFMVLLAVYTLLIGKYTHQEEAVIGTPVAGRTHPDLTRTIGMFVNMLALRLPIALSKQFIEYVNIVKEKTVAALAYQNYPFEMLVERLRLERDLSRHPLFDTVFVLQNVMEKQWERSLSGVRFAEYPWDSRTAKYDLMVTVAESSGGAQCIFNYNSQLFDRATIERMGVHFCNLIECVTANPAIRGNETELLTAEERYRLLYTFNATTAEYPSDRTIHRLFAEQVMAGSAHTAVVIGETRISYDELNHRSNQIAHALRVRGVRSDSLVGILMERSWEMIAGIFGILKAGGAYVPLDPEYPPERLAYMVKDAGLRLVLTQRRLLATLPAGEPVSLLAMEDGDWYEAYPGTDPDQDSGPAHLAYIIYTSGSSGQPKGVMIEHRNVVRLLRSKPANFDFTADDVWTLFHSYCFDFSVWEIFGPLLFGGRLVIVEAEDRLDPARFLALCRRERVTVLNQTPAAFYNLIQAELREEEHTLHTHLRYVIFGGEMLNFSKLIPWVALYPLSQTALINMYGITETTVHVTFERIREEDLHTGYRSLVGRPIYTSTLYLLDAALRPVPVGVAGEICVGGSGLARGYLHRPELTAEKFIPHPFCPGERLYRSGDVGKFHPDGNLEYLGRMDQQVKIRGYRIEAGEIEAALLNCPDVRDAVILPKNDAHGGKYLAAYVVPHPRMAEPAGTGEEPDSRRRAEQSGERDPSLPQRLKEHLGKTLPDYMIPSAFVLLESLPLTSNGKINRKALPEPVIGEGTGKEYIPPRNPIEEQLASVWERVLKLERVSTRESFFDLGGNSLLLIRLFSELKETYSDLAWQITDLFKYNSIAALADYIQRLRPQAEAAATEEMTGDEEIDEFIM